MTAPLFSGSGIPARGQVGLAALLSFNLAPLVGVPSPAHSNAEPILVLVLMQALIGVLMGLPVRTVFAAGQTAGEFIGLQMGLSFASFFDPATGAITAVLARLLNIVAMLLFISVDGL